MSSGFYPIPSGYNDNKVVLMVRDPWSLFSYWEIKREVEDRVKSEIFNKGLTPARSILRVYDVTDAAAESDYKIIFDFELRDFASSWYIHTNNPGRKWIVDVGIQTTTGEFFTLARSNKVEAPMYGMSNIYDDKWMCTEELYYKMFAIAGGYGVGKSSFEIKEMLEKHLRSWLFSGAFISSGMFGSASMYQRRQ